MGLFITLWSSMTKETTIGTSHGCSPGAKGSLAQG